MCGWLSRNPLSSGASHVRWIPSQGGEGSEFLPVAKAASTAGKVFAWVGCCSPASRAEIVVQAADCIGRRLSGTPQRDARSHA